MDLNEEERSAVDGIVAAILGEDPAHDVDTALECALTYIERRRERVSIAKA